MSENDGTNSAGGDDLSGLGSFFFYVFIVHPATAWILRPGRFERKRSILYAIVFLASLAAIKTGLDIQNRGPNFYSQLDVSRAAHPIEIKRQYKKISLKLHPDKNPSPTAMEEFNTIKIAYDVLMDPEQRMVYNKLGPDAIRQNKSLMDETSLIIELAVFYVTWGVMVFMLTMGRRNNGDARQWIFTGLIAMLVVEIAIKSSGGTSPEIAPPYLPTFLFPHMTEYEMIWLLHSLFPAFMNGCRSLGSYLYVDLEAQSRKLLLALHEQNKDILLVLRDVQLATQSIQLHGVKSSSSTAAPSTASMETGPSPILSKVTPTGKMKELQERLRTSNSTVVQAVQDLKMPDATKAAGGGNTGFYLMILGYVLLSYIFR